MKKIVAQAVVCIYEWNIHKATTEHSNSSIGLDDVLQLC